MKNSFGNALTVTLFGESHGEAIGAVIDGLSPGIEICEDYINKMMDMRRPLGDISTPRKESDRVEIVSGIFNGYTTGTPVCILIKNENKKNSDYGESLDMPRPSHADYTARCKYHGYEDHRGGGHFSGRITAALVAAGAVVRYALENKGILIGTHISRMGGISDSSFSDYEEDIRHLNSVLFPTLSEPAGKKMREKILEAREAADSVGGILETAVVGMPAGVGEPWFDTVEGVLAHILYSVPAVKGVEFGLGFGFADRMGSEANDPFRMEGDRVVTSTNNNGGVNGGITNGMPLIFRCAIKPTPSIFREQDTVSLSGGCNATLKISGRHDPAIIHRARAVIDAVTAIALGDMLTQRFGTDYLGEGK